MAKTGHQKQASEVTSGPTHQDMSMGKFWHKPEAALENPEVQATSQPNHECRSIEGPRTDRTTCFLREVGNAFPSFFVLFVGAGGGGWGSILNALKNLSHTGGEGISCEE